MLTAFAMGAYYTQGQPGKLTATESLFQEVDGGIRFDRTKVAGDLDGGQAYSAGRAAMNGTTAMFALKATCSKAGFARISNMAVHYDSEKAE